MKKQHRIVSLLLVFTMLFGSLIFTTGGTTAIAADSSSDTFTATATLESASLGSGGALAFAFDANSDINTGATVASYENNYDGFKLTSSNGDTMLELVPVTTGEVTGNCQFTLYGLTTNIAYDKTKSQYTVYDFDIATESDLLDLYITPNMRDASNSDGGLWGGSTLSMRSMFNVEPGKFHHVTIVQDLTNNKQYIFLDNILANSESTVTNGYSNWLAGTSTYKNSLKIQSHASYGSNTCKLTLGQSILFDNIGLENYSYDTGTTSLTQALAAGDLSIWEDNKFNDSYILPEVPAIAEVDGVAYNNVNAINALLSWGSHERALELLRDCAVDITVNMPTTVTTNGLTNYTAGDKVSESAAGTGTVTYAFTDGNDYDTTEITEQTFGTTTSFSASSTLFEAIKYTAGDNTITNIAFNNGYTEANGRIPLMQTNTLSGANFIRDEVVESFSGTPSKGHWIGVTSSDIYFDFTQDHFILIDFDYMIDDASQSFSLEYQVNSEDHTSDATDRRKNVASNLNTIFSAHNLPLNQFVHITLAGSVLDNLVYVFVDGELVDSMKFYNLLSDGTTPTNVDAYRYQHLRLVPGNSLVDYSVANIYVRDTVDASMREAVTSKNLLVFSENIYGSYATPTKTTTMIVDGEFAGSAAYASVKLSDGTPSYVILESDVTEDLNVAENAIIRTNGYTCNVVPANGYVVSEQEALNGGSIIAVMASSDEDSVREGTSNVSEALASGSKSDYGALSLSLVKSSIDGNLLSALDYQNFNVEHARAVYHITDTVTGNVIVRDGTYGGEVRYNSTLSDGSTNPNWIDSYVNWSVSDASTNGLYYPGEDHYLVIDADLALETNDTFALVFNVRKAKTDGSSDDTYVSDNVNRISMNTAFENAGIGLRQFAHVTVIGDTTTGIAYTFINGSLASTTEGAVCKPDIMGDQQYWLGSIRVGQNPSLNANFYYDNIAIRTLKDSTLAEVIETGDITSHDINIYGTYDMPMLPVIASVDGVYYDNEAKLAAALVGGSYKEVEFFHQPSKAVSLNCDATINTNGFKNCIAPVDGAAIISQVGAIIYTSGEGMANVQDVIVSDYDGNDRNYLYVNDVSNSITGSTSITYYENTYELSKVIYKDDTYLRVYVPADITTTDNTQITTMTGSDNSIAYDANANQYGVFDFDIATETKWIGNMFIRANVRKNSATGTYTSDAHAIKLGTLGLETGKFYHITLVQDYTNNNQYVFVNNVLVYTDTTMFKADQHTAWMTGTDDTILKLHPSFKIESDKNNTVNVYEDESILLDNIQFHLVNEAGRTLESVLTVYSDSYDMPEVQTIATIDGVEYSAISDIEAALNDGGTHAVYLLREPFGGFGTITVGSNTTIAHNGFSVNVEGAPGYKVSSSSKNIFVEHDNTEKKISIIINGTEFKLKLENGTNLKAYLEQYGSYFGDSNILALNGKLYTDVVWETVPGVISGDATYIAAGTEFTDKYLIHQNGTVISGYNLNYINTSEGSGTLYHAMSKASENSTIILNSNVTINSGMGSGSACTKDIYFNGYTMSFGGGNHGIVVNSGSILSMYGPGTIEDMGSTATHGLFYSGQTHSILPELLLKDLTINGTQALSQFRAGTMTVEGCEVNITSTQNSAMFLLGHTDATTTLTTNIIDSKISYQAYGSPSWNMFHCQSSAAGQDYVINIVGSTVVSELGLFGNTDSTVNTVVNISDSRLIAPKWNRYASSTPSPTINLIDNVSLCSSLTTLDSQANLAAGLSIVKTNDYLTSVTYAKEYATVILANGTTEKWAIGSTPVIHGSLAYVEKAEGGTQFLATGLTSAPFSLKGNLSLGAEISFNLYVPKDAPLVNISVNGVTYHAESVKLDGELCDAYRIPLTPIDAASAFDVIFNCGSYAISQNISVAKYATVIYSIGSPEAKALMSATLDFIKGTVLYSGANGLDVSEIEALISSNPVTSYTIPSTSDTDTTNITAYLDTAQLSLDSVIKFRFNLKDGVDGSQITVKVGGEARTATVTDDYIEIELQAYEMAETISFEVDGITTQNTYNLAAYCIAISSNAEGTSGNTTSRLNHIFVSDCNMLERLYNYAQAAAAYHATISD